MVVKGRISVTGTDNVNRRNKKLTLKNNASFRSKINNTFIDNAEDLDIVMPMHNLLEYNENYSMSSGNLCNYHRDIVNHSAHENNDANNFRINNNKIKTSKSFDYKTKLIGSTPNNNSRLNVVVIPLKYLSSCWRSLDLLLINYEIELDLTWSKYCIISEISKTPEVKGASPADATLTTGATFQIYKAKLYVLFLLMIISDF